uniref:Uncharacterized protein n=1 Tax=Oryza sativa subsp. japonica TaxID=39947 RepID=Q7G611_ORYSJ|nr:Unknown protein [Oryza sativa Japonica Group]AAN04511.1 Unknown protein [Oryza sativa Japonica Group]
MGEARAADPATRGPRAAAALAVVLRRAAGGDAERQIWRLLLPPDRRRADTGGLGESSGTGGLWQRVRAGFGKGSNTAGLQRWIQQPVVEQALVALGCGRAVTMDDKGSFAG